MKKLVGLFYFIFLLTTTSCEKDGDAVYITHKLILSASKTSEYVTFKWNDIQINDQVRYLLVQTQEEKDNDFYKEILDYYINGSDGNNYPDWSYECNVNYISSESTSYEQYQWGENHFYYKLLTYSSSGTFVISNTIYY